MGMKVGIFLVAMLIHASASGLTLKEYQEFRKLDSKLSDLYVYGAAMGMSWASTHAAVVENKPIFCSPSSVPLNKANYLHILDKAISEGNHPPTHDIEMILLIALVKTFPCTSSDSQPTP